MLALFSFTLVILGVSAQVGPPTIDDLNVEQYLGRWYQTYASPIVYQTFEKDGFCCTATYGMYTLYLLCPSLKPPIIIFCTVHYTFNQELSC